MKNRKNIRLQHYDYSQPGYYFVTISTKDGEHLFGEIINVEMALNDYGRIADKCLNEIPEHFPISDVDYYCIMPNHIHAIIVINDIPVGNRHACSVQINADACSVQINADACSLQINADACSVQLNADACSLQPDNEHGCFQRNKQLLPVIVGSFKSACSKLIHRLDGNDAFKWQKSYYEHIIRNEKELYEIRKYIQLNPMNWKFDNDNY